MTDPEVVDEMLRTAKAIAVVGMSDKPSRASYNIGGYLARHGYRVLPVNPALDQVQGMKCYADLGAAQAASRKETGAGIDLVDVFRASEHVPAIVIDEKAVEQARAAGVKCVENDCIYRQHAAWAD